MARAYSIQTNFFLTDYASKALANIGVQSEKMQGMFKNSFAAAETRLNNFNHALKTTAKYATGAAIGAAASGVVVATRQYAEFDNQLRRAGALFSDLDTTSADYEQSLAQIGATARDVAAKTEFNAVDTSRALAAMAQAGYTSADAMKLLSGTADMATAAGTSLGEAASIVTSSLGALGLDKTEDELRRVSDVFAMVQSRSQLDISGMFTGVAKAGGQFSRAGQDVEQLAAAAALIRPSFASAEEAGTALNAAFVQLGSSKNQDFLKSIGVNVKDAKGDFLAFEDILSQLEEALEGKGTAERAGILSSVFGTRGEKAIGSLITKGADAYKSYIAMLKGASGASATMATAMRESLQNRFEVLKSALMELGFKFVEVFREDGVNAMAKLTKAINEFDPKPVVKFVRDAATVIGTLIKVAWKLRGVIIAVYTVVTVYRTVMMGVVIWQRAHTAAVKIAIAVQKIWSVLIAAKNITVYVAQLVAAKVATLAYVAASKIAAGAQALLNGAVGVMNALFVASPIGWIVLAIGALTVAVILAHKHWDKITVAIGKAWEVVKSITAAIGGGLVNAFKSLGEWLQNTGIIDALRAIGAAVFDFLTFPLQNVLELISRLPLVGKFADIGLNGLQAASQAIAGNREGAAVVDAGPVTPASRAAASSYSRSEEVNTSQVEIGLAQGLTAQVSGAAPNITVRRSYSGAF